MPSTQVERPTANTDLSAETEESDRPDHRQSDLGVSATAGQGFGAPFADGHSPVGRKAAHRPDPVRPDSRQGSDLPPYAIRLMTGIGRALMVVGVLLLLFAAFQLWGTGLSEARAQAALADRFEQQLQDRADPRLEDAATVGPTDLPSSAAEKPEPLVVEIPEDAATEANRQADQRFEAGSELELELAPVELGDPVGVLRIPAIDVEKTVAEGTTRDVLRSGPGHYPSTPRPGERGNVAIAGHRTTHGAPFLNIDQLNPGDEITIETVDGTYTYAVEGQVDDSGNSVGHLIVRPEDVGVIMDKGDDRLTLTACHPKYSARQRIIVTAVLVSAPIQPEPAVLLPTATDVAPEPAPEVTVETQETVEADVVISGLTAAPEPAELLAFEDTAGSESLGWQAQYATPTGLWAAATAMIALIGWGFGRIWRRFPAYAMAVPPLTLSLYYCFVNLERFIPAV